MCVSLDDVTLSGQPVYVVYPATQTIFKVTDYHTQERGFVIRKSTQVFGQPSECGQVGNGYVSKRNAYASLRLQVEEKIKHHAQESHAHETERLRLARLRLARLRIELGPVLFGDW